MEAKVINLVNEKRKKQVRMGTRKLQQDLKDEFLKQGIKVGRDALFTLLRKQGMLVKRTKRFLSLQTLNIIFIHLLICLKNWI